MLVGTYHVPSVISTYLSLRLQGRKEDLVTLLPVLPIRGLEVLPSEMKFPSFRS